MIFLYNILYTFGEENTKSITKKRIIILGILFALPPKIAFNFSFNDISSLYSDFSNFDDKYLKISTISGKIHIDNNWTDARDAGICTGDGTYSNPYIIEDLVIDGGGSGSCIWIENSDVYFKIENCTLYTSGKAGIRLSVVNNSQLLDNNCSSNLSRGIYLEYSNNNTISGNTANNNWYYGICIEYSNNNNISENTANNNWYDGICIEYSKNNTISGNIMNKCGLTLFGYLEELSSHNIYTTNLVNGKPLYYYLNEINLGPNNFTNAGQLILVNCTDSLISNLNTSYCSQGISLYYCDNNNITGNTANYNNNSGLFLEFCFHNTLSGNTVNNNWYGLDLFTSFYNNVTGNSANNNGVGILLDGSDYNVVSENTAHNGDFGLQLAGSRYNNITRNNASNNGIGVYLIFSDYNNIMENELLENDECIREEFCEGNRFDNNDCGKVDGVISGYNLFFLFGILSVVPIIILKKIKKS